MHGATTKKAVTPLWYFNVYARFVSSFSARCYASHFHVTSDGAADFLRTWQLLIDIFLQKAKVHYRLNISPSLATYLSFSLNLLQSLVSHFFKAHFNSAGLFSSHVLYATSRISESSFFTTLHYFSF
jgi:triacylglycerol esterase/lipase EstA (alpha/beta hydrolase family)